MRNYKAFFRWLFVVIVRFLDEQIPSEIIKINQQELSYIAEFLYNFDEIQSERSETQSDVPIKFNLERLGQYLQDQELTILPDDEDNPWHKFLKENACLLKDNDTILSMSEFKKFSLVQQQKYLKNAIRNVFNVSQKDTGKYFSVLFNIRCYEEQANVGNSLRISQVFDSSEKKFMLAFINPGRENGIYFISICIKETTVFATAMTYYISSTLLIDNVYEKPYENINIFDLQFYSSEYLSVIMNHPSNNESSIFIQVPLKVLLENSTEFNVKSKSCLFLESTSKTDIAPLLHQGVYKTLDKIDGYRLAVSGGRKVAIVLSKSLRKVRIFEMEVDGEDEEDDTLDTTPQSLVTSQGTPDKNITSNDGP